MKNSLSFGTCGCLRLVEYVFYFTQEFRRKEGLFQYASAVLITQFGKLVKKARYKQKLRLGASRTNSHGELKSVGSGHDNITHDNVYCAIVLLAQAKCLCTIGGSKNGKPVAFERPVQNVSKVLVVFDYQDGDGTLGGGLCEVRSPVRRLSFSCAS